ncbi:MAG: hypothetical protein R2715_10530 [Ilumatobacteraceae bacterium]
MNKVPAGLPAEVDQAVVNALFTLGQAAGPFVFAPGFTTEDWSEWEVSMGAAQASLDAMASVVEDLAASASSMTPIEPGSKAEAERAALQHALVRTFGHGGPGIEVDPRRPVVVWFGSLPDGSS